MGQLLAFQSVPRASSRPAPRRPEPPALGAEILFFTGVRYERHAATPVIAPRYPVDAAGLDRPAS